MGIFPVSSVVPHRCVLIALAAGPSADIRWSETRQSDYQGPTLWGSLLEASFEAGSAAGKIIARADKGVSTGTLEHKKAVYPKRTHGP